MMPKRTFRDGWNYFWGAINNSSWRFTLGFFTAIFVLDLIFEALDALWRLIGFR